MVTAGARGSGAQRHQQHAAAAGRGHHALRRRRGAGAPQCAAAVTARPRGRGAADHRAGRRGRRAVQAPGRRCGALGGELSRPFFLGAPKGVGLGGAGRLMSGGGGGGGAWGAVRLQEGALTLRPQVVTRQVLAPAAVDESRLERAAVRTKQRNGRPLGPTDRRRLAARPAALSVCACLLIGERAEAGGGRGDGAEAGGGRGERGTPERRQRGQRGARAGLGHAAQAGGRAGRPGLGRHGAGVPSPRVMSLVIGTLG
jgi:hypothetical protein|eukprot:COSAG01_NODE_9574_length_2405_cov_2.574154_3_plen_257_part_00